MTEPSSGIESSYLEHDVGFYLHRGNTVKNSYWFSGDVIRRVYALGNDTADFFNNVHALLIAAKTKLDEATAAEDYETDCQPDRPGACSACLTYETSSFAYQWREGEFPPVDFGVTVDCKRAMTRKGTKRAAEATPIDIAQYEGEEGNPLKPYLGRRVLDEGCYQQMGSRVALFAEIFVAELTTREMMPPELAPAQD